jgi:hypothetical protein
MNRVWLYVIDKDLEQEQLHQLKEKGENFVKSWTAHDRQLHASFDILHKKIILVKVNESATEASGCSIDKLTRFITDLSAEFGLDLLNRLNVAYKAGSDVNVASSAVVRQMLDNGQLSAESLIFDTSISRQDDLARLEKPLKDTWLAKYLKTA